ncbi:LacI family DNA-binding transcriptional regulator [Thalassococcus lentus]|uniref:LacI family DNA-binding transcriptional regulator n=1 Tax=Thalassococcus lentus TaxID=1210524 RepID=A0ABT4XQ20_9RHOB|nr:LacI family DNA-binding transcriptional regulator [Thalassococcus lentus]MDA7424049.1 LacI family DNA-binding transcriptional regulator [Thalassococcus lentus]
MARRPTLRDVAREAGVSIATVNRVVGGGSVVREETVKRVTEAAARVGYHGRRLLVRETRDDRPKVRLGFVLHKQKQAFYQNVVRAIEHAAQAHQTANVEAEIVFSPSQAPSDVAAHLAELGQRVDCIAATAVNHHVVTDQVKALAENGVECISLFSDFAQGLRRCYLGMNNLKIGRGAAQMLMTSIKQPGKIALFVGGHRWHGHELRETGFRTQFRETDTRFELLDTLVNLETRQLTYEATLELLDRQPDLRGIYLAGGGMEGAIAALREERPPGKINMVVNELTPESRAALEDGYVSLVIGTPLDTICRRMVAIMAQVSADPDSGPRGQLFLDPRLHLPEFL